MKKIFSLFLTLLIITSCMSAVSAKNSYTIMREPVYNMADSFYSNITKVSKNSMWALCDTNGYPITGYKWEAMGDISSPLIPAKINGLWGYVSPEGEEKIPYQFSKADSFSEGLARVLTQDGKYAYIEESGEIKFISPFDYSFKLSGGAICGSTNNLYGFCDSDGNVIIEPQYVMAFDFSEGLAAVMSGEKWGYITTYGAYQVAPSYTYASDFNNGYAVCSLASGYGIINSSGKRTSAFDFDYIGEADDEGRFPAKRGDVSGYIDYKGNWILKTDYDFCYTYTDGVARVFKEGLWGYINEDGKEIVSPIFADCGEFRNGRAFYSEDGYYYGFLTLDPKVTNEDVVIEPSLPTISADKTNVGAYEEIIDIGDLENLPTIPGAEKCISMRIGSPYALRIKDAKRLTAAPALIDGTTMVPLRDVVEYMGATVMWDAETKSINIEYKENKVSLTVGSKVCFINGTTSIVAAAPALIDGTTMIPIRSIVSALGCAVDWIGETQNIYIHY